jgi:hypothetical protein
MILQVSHPPKNEDDVQRDDVTARSRVTGGVPDPTQPDQHSTTGTTPNDEFVGRLAGQDVGAGEETGAERRAAASGEGSERDEGHALHPEIQARLHNQTSRAHYSDGGDAG